MPQLVDTTFRLLCAGAARRPVRPARCSARRILDGAGFALTGGLRRRVFESGAARRREPVGADPRDRRADDDAARDGAARPLPRRLAAGLAGLCARFVASRGRERDRRLPAARPAQRRLEPARGGRGDRRRRPRVPRRARLQPRPHGRGRRARRAGRRLPELGAARVLVNDPTGALLPHHARSSSSARARPAASPSGSTARARPARRSRTRSSRRASAPTLVARPSIRSRSRCTGLRRVARRGARRARARHGRRRRALWQAADLVDEHIGDEPVAPLAPRIAVRAAEYDLRPGLVAALDMHLRAHAAGDRLLDTLDRGRPDPGGGRLAPARRADRPDPRPRRRCSTSSRPAATGPCSTSSALLVDGRYGDAARRRSSRRCAAPSSSLGGDAPPLEEDPPSAEDVREAAEGLASSEEDLVLLAMFGDEAEPLLQTIRQRHSREASLLGGDVDAQRAERIRELVQDRPGVRRRRDRDRGRGHARLRPARRRAGRRAGAAAGGARRERRARRARPGVPPADGLSASSRRWSASSTARRSRARRRSSRSATSSRPARRCACSRR